MTLSSTPGTLFIPLPREGDQPVTAKVFLKLEKQLSWWIWLLLLPIIISRINVWSLLATTSQCIVDVHYRHCPGLALVCRGNTQMLLHSSWRCNAPSSNESVKGVNLRWPFFLSSAIVGGSVGVCAVLACLLAWRPFLLQMYTCPALHVVYVAVFLVNLVGLFSKK